MPSSSKKTASTSQVRTREETRKGTREASVAQVTMREFRAAPAKALRRAARTGSKVVVGEFVLTVNESSSEQAPTTLHGAMADTGRIKGDLRRLLSSND